MTTRCLRPITTLASRRMIAVPLGRRTINAARQETRRLRAARTRSSAPQRMKTRSTRGGSWPSAPGRNISTAASSASLPRRRQRCVGRRPKGKNMKRLSSGNAARAILDSDRTSLWFLPAIMGSLAPALTYGARAIDNRLGTGADESFPALIFVSEPEQARELLTTILSSISTMASLVFSITPGGGPVRATPRPKLHGPSADPACPGHLSDDDHLHAAAELDRVPVWRTSAGGHYWLRDSLGSERRLVRALQRQQLARLMGGCDLQPQPFDDLARRTNLLGVALCKLARSRPD